MKVFYCSSKKKKMLTESQMIRLIEETEARIAMTETKAKNKAIFASNLFFMAYILKMPLLKI